MNLFENFQWGGTIDGQDPNPKASNVGGFENPVSEIEEDSVAEALPEVENTSESEEETVEEVKEIVPNKEEEIKTEEKEEESKEEAEDNNPYELLAQELVDSGLLHADPEKEYSSGQDMLNEILEDTIEKKYKDRFSALGDTGVNFLKHLEAGGSPETFIQVASSVDYSRIDVEDKDNQSALIAEYLEKQSYTKEEIEEELNTLNDLGEEKVLKKAQIAHRYLVNEQEKEKQRILNEDIKKAEQAKLKAQSEREALEKNMSEYVGKEIMKGFKVSKQDVENLKNYIFKADKNGETEYTKNHKLDPNRAIKLLLLDMKNFNLSNIENSVKTEKAKNLKKALSNYKDPNLTSKHSVTPKETKASSSFNFPSFFDGIE
jgi:hypothetical protein